MRRLVASLVMFGSLVLAVSAARAADVVVLVHPPGADSFVQEIFHRLAGELRVHSFSTKQEDATTTSPTISVAEALLARTHADACVFLGWQGDTSVVHVWVAGVNTPPALFEAVALQRSSDVPTMLAARAVDLLTAGLDAKRRPRATAPVAPSTPPPSISDKAPPPAAASEPFAARWSAAVGAMMLADVSRFGGAWGPLVAVERPLSRRIELVGRVAAPLVGARHANADASARLVQALALAEVLAVLFRGPRLTLRAGGGAGAYYARAVGAIAEGISSLVPGRDDRWTLACAIGSDAALAFSPRVSAVLSAQALFLVPRPRVAVGREQASLGEPVLALALGIRFAF